MRMSASRLLILVAVILFVLETLGVRLGSLSLLPLGLAFFAASFLVP
jgi:hypothetical protein